MSLDDVKRLRTQFLDVIDGAIANLENGVEVGTNQKYSINIIEGENQNYGIGVIIDTNIFNGVKTRNWGKVLNKYVYDNLAGESVIVFDEDGNEEVTSFAKKNERIKKNDSTNSRKVIDKLARKQGLHEQLAVAHAIELISVSEKENHFSYDNKHQWLDENGWEYRTVYIQDSKTHEIFSAELNIANTRDGRRILYDINNIKKVDDGVVASAPTNNGVGSPRTSTSTNNIPQNTEKSNTKKSLDVDSEGNTLSKQQQEYFKDSKVRDENGNLLVVYHGTSEEFTVFDREKGRHNMDIQGSFFSPWELDASGYGNNVRAFYLNITNPASESLGYKALRRFQGQNNTGVKAREYLESLGYDGVNNGNEEYIAFNSNQIKAVDNLNPTDSEDIRYSKDVDTDYSYEQLISKPDMPVTVIDDKKNYSPNKATRNGVINSALQSALSVGHKDESGNTLVYVNDIETNVLVSKRGLRHSLDRRLSIIAPVTENIGTILKNSIRVNELIPELDTIEKSYVLIGIAKNGNNEPYVVSFVVNRASNEIMSIDVLYAVNAKKEATALIEPELSSQSDVSLTASFISISDLLDYVNRYYPDILSEDVLKHYGYNSRPEGTLGESALYSKDVEDYDMESLIKQNEKLQKTVEYYKMMMGRNSGHKVNRRNKCALFK